MDLHKMGLRPTSPTRPITPDCPRDKHSSKFGMWQKLQHFLGRDAPLPYMDTNNDAAPPKSDQHRPLKNPETSFTRPVGIGLPRQATFKRQNSEKRERLCPIEPLPYERRAFSTSRPGSTALTRFRSSSVPQTSLPTRTSAPVDGNTCAIGDPGWHRSDVSQIDGQPLADSEHPIEYDRLRPPRPTSVTSSTDLHDDQTDYLEDRLQLDRELETKWILNLSMHFRDKSDREKFFVTYAETPSRWRRLTVSCDYRNAEPGSLEMDLKDLQLQRDKSMQIYEAIRESLLEIKFYDTVTNLKLETSDGRLHVHVTEDVNEIIPYPPTSSLRHILEDTDYHPRLVREGELSFEAHLSGFVYKVIHDGKPYIKKEIPGPDTVDEFQYEVNALHALQDSRHVIDLEAIVTDDSGQTIKGLLIDYAERGAVVDLLYDYKGEIAWEHRERWARHAIQGLSEIHEEGYVQGDLTLSNIVVDSDNNARIIDINRRGCPVGWEPPEIAKKIASNQRISMYIGQKSDLYQLGMTLWALAMDDDEPERHDPPLSTQEFPTEVPLWFQEIVRVCLSPRPRDRPSATDLIKLFPPETHATSWSSRSGRPVVRIRTEKQYIDPAAAVERDDLERFGHIANQPDEVMYSPESSRDDYTFTWPQSSSYDRDCDSASSEIERPRGRRRISDHDEELQAQRRSERPLVENSDVIDIHHEPAPVISISSDGTQSHIVNGHRDSVSMDEELNSMDRPETFEDPILNPPLTSLQLLPDRRLFPSFSETSDDTPRNSSLQLFGTETPSPVHGNATIQTEVVPNGLAGMGSHPNVSEHSLEQVHSELAERARDQLFSPIPSFSFMDSGFDEPSAFRVDLEEDLPSCEGSSLEELKENDPRLPDDQTNGTQQPLPADRKERDLSPQKPENLVGHEMTPSICHPEIADPSTYVPESIIEVVSMADLAPSGTFVSSTSTPEKTSSGMLDPESDSSGVTTSATALIEQNTSHKAVPETKVAEIAEVGREAPPTTDVEVPLIGPANEAATTGCD